jgi:hypothetical protein
MFSYEGNRKRTIKSLKQVILNDLLLKSRRFEAELLEQSSFLIKVGSTFQLFLRLFQEENIALVHTDGLPPRFDPEFFAQILYSSCVSLVGKDLQQSAFGIFALYALYETCPLPRIQSTWDWLTMGLAHPDNPKLGYRRRFRQKIRINREEYLRIQKLIHRCYGHPSQRILANDVLQIISRLEWEWSEYSGARGVEALASGISDGYFSPEDSQPSTVTQVDDNRPLANDANTSSDTLDALNLYLTKIKNIEVKGNSQQAKRVMNVLRQLPMETESLVKLMDQVSGNDSKDPCKKYSIPLINPLMASDQCLVAQCTTPLEGELHYRLRFASTIQVEKAREIASAVHELIRRDKSLLIPKVEKIKVMDEPIAINASKKDETVFSQREAFFLEKEGNQHSFDSDLSDVSEEIDDLLSDAEKYDDENAKSETEVQSFSHLMNQMSAKDTSNSVADSSIGRRALASLLRMVTSDRQVENKRNKDIQQTESNDYELESSIADSSIGRLALSNLLRHVDPKDNSTKFNTIHSNLPESATRHQTEDSQLKLSMDTEKKSRNRTPRKKSNRNEGSRCNENSEVPIGNTLSPNSNGQPGLACANLRKSKRCTKRKKDKNDDNEEMTSSNPNSRTPVFDDQSIAGSSIGRNALSLLLQKSASASPAYQSAKKVSRKSSQGKRKSNCDKTVFDDQSIAGSSIGRNALALLLQKSASASPVYQSAKKVSRKSSQGKLKTNCDKTVFDDQSIAGSSIGRNALALLLQKSASASPVYESAKKVSRKSSQGKLKTNCDKTSKIRTRQSSLRLKEASGQNSCQSRDELESNCQIDILNDGASIDGSSVGRHSLAILLRQSRESSSRRTISQSAPLDDIEHELHADSMNDKNASLSRHEVLNLKSTQSDKSPDKKDALTFKSYGCDEASTAGSSLGRQALSALLGEVQKGSFESMKSPVPYKVSIQANNHIQSTSKNFQHSVPGMSNAVTNTQTLKGTRMRKRSTSTFNEFELTTPQDATRSPNTKREHGSRSPKRIKKKETMESSNIKSLAHPSGILPNEEKLVGKAWLDATDEKECCDDHSIAGASVGRKALETLLKSVSNELSETSTNNH